MAAAIILSTAIQEYEFYDRKERKVGHRGAFLQWRFEVLIKIY